MRVRLAALACALAVLDVLCGGPALAVSYLRDVLPAHAHSEIGSTAQYGMTWILHGLHAGDAAAIAGGELSYAVMTLLGLIAAGALFLRRKDPAYAALVPPAFAVLGGTFMHYTQIMIAIPAALLLVRDGAGRSRAIFALAALLLCVPWAWALGQPALMIVYAVTCGAMAAAALRFTPMASLRIAFLSVLLTGGVLFAGYHYGPGMETRVHGRSAQPSDLAQSSWEQFVRSQRASSGAAWWIAKAPTWLGLLILALGCAYILTKEDFVTPVAIEQVPIGT